MTMDWQDDPAAQAATLIQGDARCRVWYTPTAASWAALISIHGDATAAYSFATRQEAQAWCEEQLVKRCKPRV
jgi:hypothetical protein